MLYRQRHAYLALIEPERGVYPSNIEMRAEKGVYPSNIEMRAEKVNEHYVLNGKKVSFSRGDKDYFAIVFANTAEKGTTEGLTCFLVDKDAPGFSVAGGEEKTGWRSQTREPMSLVFDHCLVLAENVLGEVGKAFHLGKKWLPSRRVVRGARCVGVAQRLLDEATTQAQSWQSFGQLIAKRTSIEAALAEIAMFIHACRLMVYEAAWKADRGESIRREAAMVKLFATEMVFSVADRVAHIFNGPPYVAGLPMEKLCRHALATSATELALELQRNIVATDILKGVKI